MWWLDSASCGRSAATFKPKPVLVKSFTRRTPVAFRILLRSKLWNGGLLTPTQRHLRAKSTEELACELVNLTRRKQKAKARLKLLLKHSAGAFADADFNRMESEATDGIAKATQAITDLKTEMKRRCIRF